MQKTFIKYTFIIMTSAIFLILFISFIISRRTFESRQFNIFQAKIEQVIHTLENNRMELAAVQENLDEDYLTRAKAAAYEYEKGKDNAFVTSGIGKLLEIPIEEVNELCKNINAFDNYMDGIVKEPVEGEEDVYRISDTKYVRIHMSESQDRKLGVIMDVTSDMTEKMRMRYENTHDALTKLYKYQYFQQLAQNILRNMPSGKICAAVMLDLDYFKGINDTFGHDIGDKYLQCFAEILGAMPPEHYLASRRSGDEFCIMIFGCGSRTDIIHYLEHFYAVLSEKQIVLSDTKTQTISASAGFAWTADLTADISVLLSHADEALYGIKKTTKGTYGEFRQEGGRT
ncbi:MAG: GGDEF domain-containing protein [Roseburia sp.]|nr:GGDEF domain-containing protein [Roseburia sp.]